MGCVCVCLLVYLFLHRSRGSFYRGLGGYCHGTHTDTIKLVWVSTPELQLTILAQWRPACGWMSGKRVWGPSCPEIQSWQSSFLLPPHCALLRYTNKNWGVGRRYDLGLFKNICGEVTLTTERDQNRAEVESFLNTCICPQHLVQGPRPGWGWGAVFH